MGMDHNDWVKREQRLLSEITTLRARLEQEGSDA